MVVLIGEIGGVVVVEVAMMLRVLLHVVAVESSGEAGNVVFVVAVAVVADGGVSTEFGC